MATQNIQNESLELNNKTEHDKAPNGKTGDDKIPIVINIDAGSTDTLDYAPKQNGEYKDGNEGKDLLGVPRNGHRMSFMEEESAKERMRLSLLKQCSAILKQGDQRYTKDSLHKTFQDEVSKRL